MNTICPNCNNNITCPDHYVGKPCICPHCQHSFTAIPTVISQTAPNSKKGKEKASEQESALSLATGTANVCIFFAVLTFIGTLITGIRTYPVPEISRIPLAGFGLIILLALLLSMGLACCCQHHQASCLHRQKIATLFTLSRRASHQARLFYPPFPPNR